MSGLFVKDFMLLKNMKQSIAIIVGIGVLFWVMNEELYTVIPYITVMFSIFSMSTVSYDEYDNGISFLFTLPIERKKYVFEKYLFGTIVSFGGFVGISIMTVLAGILRGMRFSIEESVMITICSLGIAGILLAINLPLQFKFGNEKSRIALIAAIGIAIGLGAFIIKMMNYWKIDFERILENLENVKLGVLAIVVVSIVLLVMFLSFVISMKIMQKKEF